MKDVKVKRNKSEKEDWKEGRKEGHSDNMLGKMEGGVAASAAIQINRSLTSEEKKYQPNPITTI